MQLQLLWINACNGTIISGIYYFASDITTSGFWSPLPLFRDDPWNLGKGSYNKGIPYRTDPSNFTNLAIASVLIIIYCKKKLLW